MFTVAVFLMQAYSEGQTIELLKPFIGYTTGLSEDTINTMTEQGCKNIYDNLASENNRRAVKMIKNPLLKGICKLLYV